MHNIICRGRVYSALSSGAACPVAREFGGRRRCCTDPRDRMPFSAACEIAGRIRVGV